MLKRNSNHNQPKKLTPTSPFITYIDFIKVTQKVQLIVSDHCFRVESEQVAGKSICRKQLTTPN